MELLIIQNIYSGVGIIIVIIICLFIIGKKIRTFADHIIRIFEDELEKKNRK